MLDDPLFFWKNFRLGTELQVSGSFLYNALYFFDKMDHFYYEDECFEFLYNTAVGIERLEKIVIVLLLEHHEKTNQDLFEKTLITPNHIELLNRIKIRKSIILGKTHIKFLLMLSDFYRSTRYDRFSLSSVYHKNQDKEKLIEFVSTELKMVITAEMMFPTEIDIKIKKFIGKTVSTIATKLYAIIEEKASAQNIYTYEIARNSKAYKIFVEKEYLFDKERIFQKEILVKLLNNTTSDAFINFVKQIEPLELENYDTNEYVKFLLDYHKKRHMISDLVYLYEEHSISKDRLGMIDLIGNDVSFEAPEEYDEE